MKPRFKFGFRNAELFEVFGEKSRWGYIVIGDFRERFHIPIHYWSVDKYVAQWEDSRARLRGGSEMSCFVSRMRPRNANSFIDVWVVYVLNGIAFVQNKIILCSWIPTVFGETTEEICTLTGPRDTISETGMKISEWNVPIEAITGCEISRQ